MENNFIQMAASVDHAVTYAIGLISKHIIDCVQLYFKYGSRILSFKVSINTFIFSGEGHFDLGGYVNKQNCRIWGTEKTHT